MGRLIKITMLFLLLGVVISPAFSQDELIASDERLDTDFDQYNSFDWTSYAEGSGTEYFLNDMTLKNTIRDAVKYELSARGYEKTSNNPDLLVNFRVFDEPTEFKGYTGYQEVMGNDEVREPESQKTYHLKEGTLLIQLLDKDKGTIIWQGYASGIMDGDQFDRSPERIKGAVQKIFNRFDYDAR